MKKLSEIEYVGWGYFLILWALLTGPVIWLLWTYTFETATTGTRIGFGIFLAAAVAAVFAWATNELLHRRNLRRQQAAQKAEANEQRRKNKNKKKKR